MKKLLIASILITFALIVTSLIANLWIPDAEILLKVIGTMVMVSIFSALSAAIIIVSKA